jgi:hypothetical protein
VKERIHDSGEKRSKIDTGDEEGNNKERRRGRNARMFGKVSQYCNICPQTS